MLRDLRTSSAIYECATSRVISQCAPFQYDLDSILPPKSGRVWWYVAYEGTHRRKQGSEGPFSSSVYSTQI